MRARVGSLFVWFVLAWSGVLAQPGAGWSRVPEADGAIRTYLERFQIPGMSVTIMKDGVALYSKGAGFADLGLSKPATVKTFFRLASISKSISATYVMALRDEGKLDIGKKVRAYVPAIPEHHTCTIRDILCHQSGIRHYAPRDESFSAKPYSSSLDASGLFWKDPLTAAPGTKYRYSTHAYTILAAVVEKAIGKRFGDGLNSFVAKIGVTEVRPETLAVDADRRANVYGKDGENLKVVRRDDISWKLAGGGMEATSVGLANFAHKLVSGAIVRGTTLEEMWTEQKANGESSGYGLGFRISTHRSKRMVGHDGEQLGARSHMRLYPDDRVVIVVLTNCDDHDLTQLGAYLADLVFAKDGETLPELQLSGKREELKKPNLLPAAEDRPHRH